MSGPSITLLFLLTATLGLCQGPPSVSLFQKAKTLELEQEYLEACIIYDTLVQRGYRVDEIQSKRLYRQHREMEDRFLKEMEAGDAAFATSKFIEAREAYYRANSLHPEDTYPKDQIKKINELLKAKER